MFVTAGTISSEMLRANIKDIAVVKFSEMIRILKFQLLFNDTVILN
jgi:hypothetical protein